MNHKLQTQNKLQQIKDLLKEKGLRITDARLAVGETLIDEEKKFFAAEEILQKILSSKKYHCDQASVYRTLSTFEELGIVTKSTFYGEAARFQINQHLECLQECRHDSPYNSNSSHHQHQQNHGHSNSNSNSNSHSHHHEHFFKCLKCQKIEPFQECLVNEIEKIFTKKGYRNIEHRLEISGLCPKCATKNKRIHLQNRN